MRKAILSGLVALALAVPVGAASAGSHDGLVDLGRGWQDMAPTRVVSLDQAYKAGVACTGSTRTTQEVTGVDVNGDSFAYILGETHVGRPMAEELAALDAGELIDIECTNSNELTKVATFTNP
jgi:hypothetical protein